MNFPTTTMYEDYDDAETEAENLYDMKLITLKAVEPHTAPCLPWVESSMYKIATSIGVFRVFLKRSIFRCINTSVVALLSRFSFTKAAVVLTVTNSATTGRLTKEVLCNIGSTFRIIMKIS